jgi:NTE family protein
MRVDNTSPLSTKVIERRLDVALGEPLDVADLIGELDALYGDGIFDRVHFSIDEVGDENELVVHSVGKETGRNFLRFGLNLETNFRAESRFDLGVLATRLPVNGLGGEWQMRLSVGERTGLVTEFFQPLDYGSNFFVAPELVVGINSANLYQSGVRVAKLEQQGFAARLGTGVLLDNWGEFRLGLGYSDVSFRRIIGSPTIGGGTLEGGEAFGRLTLDTLDSVRFPRSGGVLRAQTEYQAVALGSPVDSGTVSAEGLYAWSFGENTISPVIRIGTTYDAEDDAPPRFQAGGFLNLSGLSPGELTGRHLLFGSIVAYRRLANPRFFTLSLPVYLGGSIEAGNTFDERGQIAFRDLIIAGSVFVGVDTPIGPIYVAYGLAENGRSAGYFFLGQRF